MKAKFIYNTAPVHIVLEVKDDDTRVIQNVFVNGKLIWTINPPTLEPPPQ